MIKTEWKKYIWEGKDVGVIREDGRVFLKYVKESNIFRKYNGVGISEDLLNELEKEGVIQIKVVVIKKDGNEEYRVALRVWKEEGIEYYHIRKSGGTDLQLILPFNLMEKEE